MDGSNRGLIPESTPADRAQANQAVGKGSKLILAYPCDTLAKTLGKGESIVKNGQQAKQSQTTEIKLFIQESSNLQDRMVYSDDSDTNDLSGWGFTVTVFSSLPPCDSLSMVAHTSIGIH